MNKDIVDLLRVALSQGEIVLPRAPKAGSKLAAEVVYFILIFGLGLAGLLWRVVIRPNEPSQAVWDFVLASLFLISGLLIGIRTLWLLRCSSWPFVLSDRGIEWKGEPSALIAWTELSAVYVLPFVVVFRGASKTWMAVGFYTWGFPEIRRLFDILTSLSRGSPSIRFGLKAEMDGVIKTLYRGQKCEPFKPTKAR